MRDYEELARSLRACTDPQNCNKCKMNNPCQIDAQLSRAADAIEELHALAQNGASAIDTGNRLAKKVEELQSENNELLFRCGQAEALIDYYQGTEPPKEDENG